MPTSTNRAPMITATGSPSNPPRSAEWCPSGSQTRRQAGTRAPGLDRWSAPPEIRPAYSRTGRARSEKAVPSSRVGGGRRDERVRAHPSSLFLKVAFENGDRGAGHDQVLVVSPLDPQVAAQEMNDGTAGGATGAGTGDHGGAGSGPAGEGLPHAPLPDAHPDLLGTDDLDELGVRTVGKRRVAPDQRAE